MHSFSHDKENTSPLNDLNFPFLIIFEGIEIMNLKNTKSDYMEIIQEKIKVNNYLFRL